MNKPGLPQGTRDFGPETVYKRHFIFDTIRGIFELYGYEPLETPAMENLETLLGKYGEEGDKLLFKILNNGLDHPSKKDPTETAFREILAGKNSRLITERALRYDLTIPFARYVATNHKTLNFPFKRYQLQPVWRADRPQKGRYREFYQCDADVVGSRSPLNEVEQTRIYLQVFKKLGLEVELRINHRRILAALADACGGQKKLIAITTAIDKLDKIGPEKVKDELAEKGLSADQISLIRQFLEIKGSNEEKLTELQKLLNGEFQKIPVHRLNEPTRADAVPEKADDPARSPATAVEKIEPTRTGSASKEADDPAHSLAAAVEEIRFLLNFFRNSPDAHNIIVDPSLARGLNYYTGIIFEVRAKNVQIGSIGGGGRYDNLTGLFGVPDIPGVGISFGVDRIYDAMEELKLFPETVQRSTEFLFFNLGPEAAEKSFELAEQFRARGIRCELYPESVKFDKQFRYAEKKHIPFIIIIGPDEMRSGRAKIKNLSTGVQEECGFGEMGDYAEGLRDDG